jgi:uncharacterized protein involved in exopolysaccharide biosynthesis
VTSTRPRRDSDGITRDKTGTLGTDMPRGDFDSPEPAHGAMGAGDDGMLEQVMSLVRVHWRLFLFVPAGAALLTAIVVLALPKTYTTVVSFTPVSSAGSLGAMAGLAGQFGVNLPTSDPAASPDFYAALLQTREVLQPIVQQPYRLSEDSAPRTFIQIYDIRDGDSARTLGEAMRVLQRDILTIGFDRQTGIVSLRIRTRWPELSYQIGEHTVSLLNGFNLQSRQTQAGAERVFLAERLDTVRAELRLAENRLQDFLQRNRSYTNDPILSFEHDRLQRDVALRQEVYSTLTQSFEQARLSSVRNTPSISIVESPKLALRFDRRHTLSKMVAASAVGLVIAFAWVFASAAFVPHLAQWRQTRREPLDS